MKYIILLLSLFTTVAIAGPTPTPIDIGNVGGVDTQVTPAVNGTFTQQLVSNQSCQTLKDQVSNINNNILSDQNRLTVDQNSLATLQNEITVTGC